MEKNNEVNIIDYFKHLWNDKKFYLVVFLTFFVPILLYSYIFLDEKYEVKMILKPYDFNAGQNIGVGSFFGTEEQTTPEFTKFKSIYKSPDLALRLIKSADNPMKIIYKYDSDGNHISSLTNRIKSLLYYRKLPHTPDHYDLSDYISEVVSLDYDDASETYIFSMRHNDVNFAKNFLQTIFNETDSFISEIEENLIESRLAKLRREIEKTNISEVKTSISNKIASDIVKKSLLDSNLNYSAQIISNVGFSKYPVTPNLLYIYFFAFVVSASALIIMSTFRISQSKD